MIVEDYFLQFFLHWPLCVQSLQLVLLQVALHSVHISQLPPQEALASFFSQHAFFFSQHAFFFSQHSFLFLSHLWS